MILLRSLFYNLIEKLLHWCLHAKLRAIVMKIFGAELGYQVRINEIYLSGLWNGFKNLKVGDKAFIGELAFLDLTGTIHIGSRTSISPKCTIITHQDPGSMLENKLAEIYPRIVDDVIVGDDCWIGTGTIILSGVRIGSRVVVGAGSLVEKDIPDDCVACGVPAKVVKRINVDN